MPLTPQQKLHRFFQDTKLKERIRGDEYNLNIHDGNQGKHIKGHNNDKGESYLFKAIDPQSLVDKYAATGELKRVDRTGDWTNKAFVVADEYIGVVVKEGVEIASTKYFSIHYSKN